MKNKEEMRKLEGSETKSTCDYFNSQNKGQGGLGGKKK